MELLRNGRPRVVITGMGAVTALGGVKNPLESLKAGKIRYSPYRKPLTSNTAPSPLAVSGYVA